MTILGQILARKAEELAEAKGRCSLSSLEARIPACDEPRGFASALRRDGGPVRVIAEYKRASPSAGVIRDDLSIEDVARSYEEGGASAMSVLTDHSFFHGHLDFLARARAVTELPLLRKDFLIDPYQVVEAKVAGADAVLLIVSALSDSQLAELLQVTAEMRLDALVEVHSEREASRAVAAGANIIGVNHRDLKTFEIDMGLTARLRATVPESKILVGESGIRGSDDVSRLGRDGASAVLIGEHFMRAPNPGDAVRDLLSGVVQ